jgi:hypothetical protein
MGAAIRVMHQGMRARVRVEGVLSDEFEMLHGVRQGCVKAPILFNLVFAFVVRRAEQTLHGQLGEDFGVQLRHRETAGTKRSTPETSIFDPRDFKTATSKCM